MKCVFSRAALAVLLALPAAAAEAPTTDSKKKSDAYRKVLKGHGLACSMSRKGNCWDNAVAESFFSTLKMELIHRRTWDDRATTRLAVAEYIECFYNSERRHSTLDYQSPAEHERLQAAKLMTAA